MEKGKRRKYRGLYPDKCDHCGKFARQGGGMVTLEGLTNGHPHEMDVAICESCGDKEHTPEYWFQWLEKRYPK